MIINHWGPEFTKLYGHLFPESYLCIDTEYTGGNAEKDLIIEIGHVLVEDRHVVDQLHLVLDWSNHAIVPDHWVRTALRRVELKMAESGRKWRLNYDVMREEGIKPEKALQFYYDLLTAVQKRGLLFAAHHGFFAEERMLKAHFEGFLQKPFRFGENGLFDTGAIEKASQAMDCHDPEISRRTKVWLPQPGDSLEGYFRRVVFARAKGIYWNLEHCAKKYNLYDKYSLDPGNHHTAEFDALLVHYLMEEYRSRVFHVNVQEDPTASPAALQRMFEQELAKQIPAEEKRQRLEQARREYEEEGRPVRRPVRRRGQRSV